MEEIDKELRSDIERWSKMQGPIKKKRKQGSLISRIDSSVVRYFKLWHDGKFLCYYDEAPDFTKPPKGVTFITEILQVIPNYKGKTTHFYLKLKGLGKDLHLKCDDKKDTKSWVESLSGLSDYYKGKKIVNWIDERKDYKSEIDVRINVMIMEEQEKLMMSKIKEEMNYDDVLKIKDIAGYMDMLDPQMTENRIAMGWSHLGSGKEGVSGSLSNWVDVFCIIATSKSYDETKPDNELLSENDLPPWMDRDTLYLFKFDGEEDNSEYIKKISGRQMLMIEFLNDPSMKGNFTIGAEMKDKMQYLGFKFATTANKVIKAMRRAKKSEEETARAKKEVITRNVDSFIDNFRNKKGELIQERIHDDFDKYEKTMNFKKTSVPGFLKVIKQFQEAAFETLDALQAHRPFYPILFKLYLKKFHIKWTNIVKKYWNHNRPKFAGVEILQFLDLVYQQDKIAKDFGLVDPRYDNSFNELISTFCVRTFHLVMPMVMTVLENMQKNTYLEGTTCLSYGPIDLFKFLCQVIEGYSHCPQSSVCSALLGLSYKIVFNFQKEFREIVCEADDMELDIYAALTNSNVKFLSLMRDFMDQVRNDSGLELEAIKASLSQSQLIKGFGLISNSSFLRIQDLVEDILLETMLKLPPHAEFQIEEWIEETFIEFKQIFDKMYQSYGKKLWKFIIDKFILLFSQYILRSTLAYSPDDIEVLLEKLNSERETIFEIFSEVISEKQVEKYMKKLDLVIECLTLPTEQIVVSIANLRIQMKKKHFNTKCIKCILRMRKDISRDEKIAMFQVLEQRAASIKDMERKHSGSMFRKNIMVDMLVQKFCRKFKVRLMKKRNLKKQKEQNKLNNELLKINENEKAEIEEESFNMRGFLGMYSKTYQDEKKKSSVIEKIENHQYSKNHFSFLDDIILWKKKPTSKTVTKKIYLVTIDEIGVEGENYFWFSKPGEMYCVQCASEEERKRWVKALIFLRDESLEEIQPLVFEEFDCVYGAEVYDELFEPDVVNYDYESIKIKKKEEKHKKTFDMDDLEVGDKEMDGDEDDQINELSLEELSWSSADDHKKEEVPEEEESDDDEEFGEGKDNKEKMEIAKKKAKKLLGKHKGNIMSSISEFRDSKEDGNLYDRTKKWFGFY